MCGIAVLEAGSALMKGTTELLPHIVNLLKLLDKLRVTQRGGRVHDSGASNNSNNTVHNKNLQAFVNWLREHKVKNVDQLRIERVAEGYGVVAHRDVKQGEVLFEIPEELFFSPKIMHANPKLAVLLESELVADNQNVQLVLSLISEKYNGSSKWQPYIHILPTTFVTPLYWNEEEWKLFHAVSQQDRFYHIAGLFITQLRLFTAVHALLQKHPEAMDAHTLTWENWAWASACVFSRANPYPNMDNHDTRQHFLEQQQQQQQQQQQESTAAATATPTTTPAAPQQQQPQTGWNAYHMLTAMIPVYDTFNHGFLTPAEMKAAASSTTTTTRKSEYDVFRRVMEVIPIRDTKKDSQIYIWYGHRPNSGFFESQGFVPENNPYDMVVLYGNIPESTPFYQEKLAILQRLPSFRVNQDKSIIFPLTADLSSPQAPSATFFFRLLCIQDKEFINPKIVTRSFADNAPISWENEISAMNFLALKIQSRLSKYATSEDEDKSRLASLTAQKELTPAKRLILQYAMSEKQLLARALKNANDMKAKAEAKKAKKDKEKQKKAAK
jgi:hypothetical protein